MNMSSSYAHAFAAAVENGAPLSRLDHDQGERHRRSLQMEHSAHLQGPPDRAIVSNMSTVSTTTSSSRVGCQSALARDVVWKTVNVS